MTRPAILLVTAELPYPPVSGGRIKSWRMIRHVSTHYRLTVACVLKGDDAKHLPEMQAELPGVTVLSAPVNRPRSVTNLVRSYARGEPLNVFRTHSRALASAIANAAPEHDLLLLDHYESAQYVPEGWTRPVLLHEHNAYFTMWERFARATPSAGHRLVARLEARRVRRYEVAACQRADQVLAAPNDIEQLCAAGVSPAKCKETFHLGDDAPLTAPDLDLARTDKQLLYFGLLSWEANTDGLMWFLEQVYPQIKARHPETRLRIAGKGASPRLQATVDAHPDVSLLGFVDDLEPLLATSRVFIAPLRFGAGIKVKVLTALARGLPTVTTSIGAEGLAVASMSHLAIADTAADFANAVSHLLEDDAACLAMATAARALVRERYTWDRILAGLDEAIGAAMAAQA